MHTESPSCPLPPGSRPCGFCSGPAGSFLQNSPTWLLKCCISFQQQKHRYDFFSSSKRNLSNDFSPHQTPLRSNTLPQVSGWLINSLEQLTRQCHMERIWTPWHFRELVGSSREEGGLSGCPHRERPKGPPWEVVPTPHLLGPFVLLGGCVTDTCSCFVSPWTCCSCRGSGAGWPGHQRLCVADRPLAPHLLKKPSPPSASLL